MIGVTIEQKEKGKSQRSQVIDLIWFAQSPNLSEFMSKWFSKGIVLIYLNPRAYKL